MSNSSTPSNLETTLNMKSSPDWKPVRGLCELLANAIDAMRDVSSDISDLKLTYTKNISFSARKDTSYYEFSIRDFGSGISPLHLTSQGKSSKRNTGVDTMFNGYHGKGLLESIAVLVREGFSINIQSKYLHVRATLTKKENIAFEYIPSIQQSKSILSFLSSSSNSSLFEGTEIIISKNEDFENLIDEMKNEFIYFESSRGKLLETTKFGRIYLSPKGETGRVFMYGFRIYAENGVCQNCYYTYDFYNATEIDKAIRNTESGNNRKLTSRKISIQLHKIHDEVSSPEIIKKARKLIKDSRNEFKDKVTQKKYSDKKILKTGTAGNEDLITQDDTPTLEVEIIKKEIDVESDDSTLSSDNDSSDNDRNYDECIVHINDVDRLTIKELKSFLKKHNLQYEFN
jgi:hypothetical protein